MNGHDNPEILDSEEEEFLQQLRADDEKLAADKEYAEWVERCRVQAHWDDRDWDERD